MKTNYTEAMAYHPTSPPSFLFQTVEKLVARHVRDKIFGVANLHQYQLAYQPGKSPETALHNVLTHTEEAHSTSQYSRQKYTPSRHA
jgi:squalene cyclase